MRKGIALLFALIFLASCGQTPNEIETTSLETSKATTTATTEEAITTTTTATTTTHPEPKPESINIPPNNLKEEELRLWNSITEQVDEQIILYDIYDYDEDGALDILALVGLVDNDAFIDPMYEGDFWLANSQKTEAVFNLESYYHIDFLQFGKDRFITAQPAGTNWQSCLVLKYSNGYFCYSNASGLGMDFAIGGHDSYIFVDDFTQGELVCRDSEYDSVWNNGGHTWKPYWFFYDENDRDFKEYGGIEITFKQFMMLKNATKVIEEIEREGNNYYDEPRKINLMDIPYENVLGLSDNEFSSDNAVLFSIYYRGNGVINITYGLPIFVTPINPEFKEKGDIIGTFHMQNTTVRYNGKEIVVTENWIRWDGGHYLSALNPEIAIYPDISELFD